MGRLITFGTQHTHTNTCTHKRFMALDFVWDNPGELVPEWTTNFVQ